LQGILKVHKVIFEEKRRIRMARCKHLPLFAILILNFLSLTAWAQDIPGLEWASAEEATRPRELPTVAATPPMHLASAPVTVAPGTHVLMVLSSPLHSTSGVAGSGVYLETIQPVIQDNHVVIPAHTQVQGIVEVNKRPGHFSRTAEFKFRFTALIFPNNHVSAINGALQSIPGSRLVRIHRQDGKLKSVDQTDKVVVAAIVGATGGGLLGSISRVGIGRVGGGGLGAGFGLETALLQRGDDITLGNGTRMEMVLESPFVLEPEQAAFNAGYIPPRQAQPLEPQPQQLSQAQVRRAQRRRARAALFPRVIGWY
jgi:hypothetical protein